MLALVDLYLCIHRILLHYLIKICVIIFFNIFCNNLLLPAKPRLQKKTSRVTLTYFDFCDLISQWPVTQDKPNNGQWYVPTSQLSTCTHYSITYFTQYQLTHVCSITIAVAMSEMSQLHVLCASAQLRGRYIPLSIVWLILGDWCLSLTDEVTKVKVGQGDSRGIFFLGGA